MGLFDNDPKYQALKNLRESGWTGPVDQDGRKVEDVDAWGRDILAAGTNGGTEEVRSE